MRFFGGREILNLGADRGAGSQTKKGNAMSWLSDAIHKVEAWFESVNWTNVTKDFDTAITDIETVIAPIVGELFPGTKSTIADVVTPVLNNAKAAADALTTTAQAVANGTASASQLTSAAHTVQAAVVAASTLVSAATQGKQTTPAPAQAPAMTGLIAPVAAQIPAEPTNAAAMAS